MSGRAMFYNLGTAAASRLGSALLTFILFWWLARELALADVGAFALMMSIFGLLQLMPLLGLHIQLSREASLSPERLSDSIHEHIWFSLPVAATLACALMVYGQTAQGGGLVWPFCLLALAMLPTAWTTVAEAALIGLERLRSIVEVNLLEACWRLVGSAVVLRFGGSLTAVMVIFLIGRLVAALLYLRLPELPRLSLRRPPSRTQWLAMWRLVPLFLGIALLAALSSRLDVLMLSNFVLLDQLGQYAAGAKLYEAALMVPTLAALVILPTLTRLFKEDRGTFAQVLPNAMRLLLAGGLALALVGAAFAPQALAVLFPVRFAASALVIQVLLFAAVFATVDMLLSSVMIASYAQRQDLHSLIAGMVVLVLGIFLLVPRMGPVGAAVAVTLHMLVRVFWRARWFLAEFSPQKFGHMFAGAGLAAVAGIGMLVYMQSLGNFVAAMTALAAYFFSAWVCGLLRATDIAMLITLMPKRQSRGAP